MSRTIGQERALAITPKITSTISICSSIFVIYEVYCDYYYKKRNSAIQRVLVGMSSIDIFASFGWFLSTWAVPKNEFAFATGNEVTCNFQGFLLQLAVGAPLYNSSLALLYLLVIKYNWSNDMLIKIEKWVHGTILTFSIGTSITLLLLKQYNHIGAVCWVIGRPSGCGHSTNTYSDIPCDRGEYAYLYGLFLFYIPLWICVLACMISMCVIYREVKVTHARLQRYGRSTHSLRRSSADTSLVAMQAMLYSITFILTWMPSTIWSITHWFHLEHYTLDYLAAFCEPLQGFWNCMVFIRRRPSSKQKLFDMFLKISPCCYNCFNINKFHDSITTTIDDGHNIHGVRRFSRYMSSSLSRLNLAGLRGAHQESSEFSGHNLNRVTGNHNNNSNSNRSNDISISFSPTDRIDTVDNIHDLSLGMSTETYDNSNTDINESSPDYLTKKSKSVNISEEIIIISDDGTTSTQELSNKSSTQEEEEGKTNDHILVMNLVDGTVVSGERISVTEEDCVVVSNDDNNNNNNNNEPEGEDTEQQQQQQGYYGEDDDSCLYELTA